MHPGKIDKLTLTSVLWPWQKKAKSQVLLDKVFGHLELVEKDYFGLQFVDLSPAPDGMISHAHHPVGPYAMVCGFFVQINFNLHFKKCYNTSYNVLLCTFIH